MLKIMKYFNQFIVAHSKYYFKNIDFGFVFLCLQRKA